MVENVFDDVLEGQSIAHDGVCLTVEELVLSTQYSVTSYRVFVMDETFAKTNL